MKIQYIGFILSWLSFSQIFSTTPYMRLNVPHVLVMRHIAGFHPKFHFPQARDKTTQEKCDSLNGYCYEDILYFHIPAFL